MGKVTFRDGTPEDVQDWPDALLGAPVAGEPPKDPEPSESPEPDSED